MIPFDVLVDVVRFKLYEALTVDGMLRPDLMYLGTKFDGKVTNSFLSTALRQLEISKHIEVSEGKNGPSSRLLPAGIRSLERQLSDPESAPSKFRDSGFAAFDDRLVRLESVPASDRVVALDHNSAEFEEAKSTIAEIKDALAKNNQVGEAFGDDRQVAISEINQVDAALQQPRVRTASFLELARRTLTWFIEKGAGTLVAELSKKLFALLLGWIS